MVNKWKFLALVLIAMPSVWGQKPAEILSPLQPGLTWKVEGLPISERILGEEGNEENGRQEEVPTGRLLETNKIGEGFREQIIHHPDGRTETRIILTSNQLMATPEGTYQFFLPDEDDPAPGSALSRLEEFSWLDNRWLLGRTTVEGTECLVYRAPWPPGSEAPPADENTPRRFIAAAVGVDDRLPRRLETPFAVRRYVFEKLAEIPRIPPAALDFLLQDRERGEKNARRYRIPQ